jgi:pimeloyl-ACP methyl ester carboxylesterase
MVHGWRSEKLNRLENVFLSDFKKLKYNVYSYILPFHMDRQSGSYGGEYFYSANINRTLKSFQQAVSDIRALIKHLKSCNNKIILIGLSLGGLISNLISEHEENINLLVSIFPAT